MTLKQEFRITSTFSAEDNVLRILFTFFFNLGTFDQTMRDSKGTIKFESKRKDHIGRAFVAIYSNEIKQEFLQWANLNDLARFIMENHDVRDACIHRFDHAHSWHEPLDTIVGERYEKITGLKREKLPRDLKKSFLSKATNLLNKFIKNGWNNGVPYRGNSLENVIQLILAESERNIGIASPSLQKLKNLYWKTIEHETIDDEVDELLKLARVADVMET